MASYVFDPSAQPSVAVEGTDARFPVRRIYCVGRNYASHAVEMGSDPEREPPFFFCKPADALLEDGATLAFPQATDNLHHEVELVVALRSGGKGLSLQQAKATVFAYAVGIDLARRDLQAEAKETRRPWDAAKAFDQSAAISALVPTEDVGLSKDSEITLAVNGEQRQYAQIGDLIWSVEETICALSKLFELKAGDLIYTGTPAGVGRLVPGDRVTCSVAGVGTLELQIAEKSS